MIRLPLYKKPNIFRKPFFLFFIFPSNFSAKCKLKFFINKTCGVKKFFESNGVGVGGRARAEGRGILLTFTFLRDPFFGNRPLNPWDAWNCEGPCF